MRVSGLRWPNEKQKLATYPIKIAMWAFGIWQSKCPSNRKWVVEIFTFYKLRSSVQSQFFRTLHSAVYQYHWVTASLGKLNFGPRLYNLLALFSTFCVAFGSKQYLLIRATSILLNKIFCHICQSYICVITSDLKSNKEALLDGGGNVRAGVRALEMKCSYCGVM